MQELAVAIEQRPALVGVDRERHSWWSWDDYCREVIWFGNKKGAYLYEHQSAGGSDSDALVMAPSPAACEPENMEPEIAGIY